MVYRYAINTAGVSDLKEMAGLFSLISEDRRQKISRFIFMKDKVHSLFAEIMLRYILCKRYGFMNSQIEFRYSDYGKPYIVDNSDIYFNLSHSGNWVLCAVGDVPLGIDVEIMKDKDLDIADRFYAKEENDFISAQTSEDKLRTFYKLWTLKESYVKNIGLGLSIPFDSFFFRIKEDDIQLFIKGRREHDFLFYVSQLDDLHCTALCVKSKFKNMVNANIKILTIRDLLKWYETGERN